SCGYVSDCFPAGGGGASTGLAAGAGVRPDQQFRAVEAGVGSGPETMGNIQRPEFWRADGSVGDCGLYRSFSGFDDAETIKDCAVTGLRPVRARQSPLTSSCHSATLLNARSLFCV